MKSNPRVSVIIPNYNHARYLDERINTVLEQTFQDFEIIILDDKSTDDSVSVISKYKDNPHVSQIVVNEENSGKVFSQWHKGFELAKGELIWIAESDDKCLPTLLEELIPEFDHDSNLALAFSRTVCFTDDGHESISYGKITDSNTQRMDGRQFISKYMAGGCYVTNASSAVFRKDIAMSIEPLYADFRGAGDRLFWIEIAEKGNVAIINKPLNYCRRHGSNVTSKNIISGLLACEDKRIMDYLWSNQLVNRWQKKWYSAEYIYNNILRSTHISPKKKKELECLWEYKGICRLLVSHFRVRAWIFNVMR